MTKSELRLKYKGLRNQLSDAELILRSSKICEQLIIETKKFNSVHLFFPIQRLKEIDLTQFKNHLLDNNKTVVTSVMDENLKLTHVSVDKTTSFNNDSFGIPTPIDGTPFDIQNLEAIIIPLLAYDTNGNRIGYGKGIYDSFLKTCPRNSLKIGVSYFPPEDLSIEPEQHDIPLNMCICPDYTHYFG